MNHWLIRHKGEGGESAAPFLFWQPTKMDIEKKRTMEGKMRKERENNIKAKNVEGGGKGERQRERERKKEKWI